MITVAPKRKAASMPQAVRDEIKRLKAAKRAPLPIPAPRDPGAGRPPKSPLRTKRGIAVQRYMRDIKEAAPWLEVADVPLVRRFCEMQVAIAALYFEIHSHGIFDSNRQPRFVLETYRRMVLAQTAVARELGLTPLARRQLALSASADDLAAALAQQADDEGERVKVRKVSICSKALRAFEQFFDTTARRASRSMRRCAQRSGNPSGRSSARMANHFRRVHAVRRI